jgi:hypothetical protein
MKGKRRVLLLKRMILVGWTVRLWAERLTTYMFGLDLKYRILAEHNRQVAELDRTAVCPDTHGSCRLPCAISISHGPRSRSRYLVRNRR